MSTFSNFDKFCQHLNLKKKNYAYLSLIFFNWYYNSLWKYLKSNIQAFWPNESFISTFTGKKFKKNLKLKCL